MTEKMTFRALRVNRGKTQEECANMLGISLPTYRSKEEDITKWKWTEVCDLAEYLDYPLEAFKR